MSASESETETGNAKLTIHSSNEEAEILPTDYLFLSKRLSLHQTDIPACDYEIVIVPDSAPQPPEQKICTPPSPTSQITMTSVQIYPMETITIDHDDPDGQCSTFYNCCYCFAKRFVSNDNQWIYKRICKYVYNTDGLSYIGLYNYKTNDIYYTENVCDNPDIRYCTLCTLIHECYEYKCWKCRMKIKKCCNQCSR